MNHYSSLVSSKEQKTRPVTGPRCKTCCKEIHFDNVWFHSPQHQIIVLTGEQDEEENDMFIESTHENDGVCPTGTEEDARLKINQRLATFKLETGCQRKAEWVWDSATM